jgi:hypothetical protein
MRLCTAVTGGLGPGAATEAVPSRLVHVAGDGDDQRRVVEGLELQSGRVLLEGLVAEGLSRDRLRTLERGPQTRQSAEGSGRPNS